MKLEEFPKEIAPHLIPETRGELYYECLGCHEEFGIDTLLYTCPRCGKVLLIHDRHFSELKKIPGPTWRKIFDYRKMLKIPALKGIYLFHEFIGSTIPLSSIIYLGEGHTPIIEANSFMKEKTGLSFYFKNDGQNPSASFKDRGMASAMSYINYLITKGIFSNILAVCASTGDTSASAALYASYLKPNVKSAVLLPHKKVTAQQLSQPLGSGARVFEIPGVFDDCMKVVENLSENYDVALLNSKNAWRILGQESYSYEVAQAFDYDMKDKVIVVPIGNAGNITAILNGFIKFFETGIIEHLPKIIGVQSHHANPVYEYYQEQNPERRQFKPVTVQASVAQAAMIGNPVSMPRVVHMVDKYNALAGENKTFFVQVEEQEIMDWELLANQNGHIACTQGGESLAGAVQAKRLGFIGDHETTVVDSTAHALKFSGFQEMYFENTFPEAFGIAPDQKLINAPLYVHPKDLLKVPGPGAPLEGEELSSFIKKTSDEIAQSLNLKKIRD